MKIEITKTQEIVDVTTIDVDTKQIQKMFKSYIKRHGKDSKCTLEEYIELILNPVCTIDATEEEEDFYWSFYETEQDQMYENTGSVTIKAVTHSH